MNQRGMVKAAAGAAVFALGWRAVGGACDRWPWAGPWLVAAGMALAVALAAGCLFILAFAERKPEGGK